MTAFLQSAMHDGEASIFAARRSDENSGNVSRQHIRSTPLITLTEPKDIVTFFSFSVPNFTLSPVILEFDCSGQSGCSHLAQDNMASDVTASSMWRVR